MRKKTAFFALIIVSMFVFTGFATFVSDDDSSDAASGCTARVFAEINGSTVEMGGNGNTVKEIINSAVASKGYTIVINGNGSIGSFNGIPGGGKTWVLYQWEPPAGWQNRLITKDGGDRHLKDGTSYYIYLADQIHDKDKTRYTEPSYKPQSTAYFYIKWIDDVNAGTSSSILTEDQRKAGFWIEGTGFDAAEAFKDACSKYGMQLDMSTGVKDGVSNPDFKGWLNSFMGLKDVTMANGQYKYWSQYHLDGGSWRFSDCLGHYDPNVVEHYGFVRQVTEKDSAISTITVGPGDVPANQMKTGCTVSFVDGDGGLLKTQNVSYFGSATAPVDPVKSPSGGKTYVFTGWDKDYAHILNDMTVTAQFSVKGSAAVTGVSMTHSVSSIEAGSSCQFKALVSPEDAANISVGWSSSNPSVATVDSKGNVTGVSPGRTIITVTTQEGGRTASSDLRVIGPSGAVTFVNLDCNAVVMQVGSTLTLNSTVNADAVNDKVTWSSSNGSVAAVSANGRITPGSVGDAVITVTTEDGGRTACCKVRVVDEPTLEMLSDIDLTGSAGDRLTVSVLRDNLRKLADGSSHLRIVTDIGTLDISNGALKDLAGMDTNVSFGIEVCDRSGLLDSQKDKVGDSEVFRFSAYSGGRDIGGSMGGKVSVTMPYALADGRSPDDIRVYCIDSRGVLEELDCAYDSVKGAVTFETTQFSMYFATVDPAHNGSGNGNSIMIMVVAAIAAIAAVAAISVYMVRRRRA